MANAAYRMQDHLVDYDFEHHEVTPEQGGPTSTPSPSTPARQHLEPTRRTDRHQLV